MVVLASTLGKKKPSPVKSAPFECGKNPFTLPGGKLAIKFYLTAILFILFDVESRLPLPMGRGLPQARNDGPGRDGSLSGDSDGGLRLRLGQRRTEMVVTC